MVWPYKFKVGHHDLIIMTPHSPEKPENLNIPTYHNTISCTYTTIHTTTTNSVPGRNSTSSLNRSKYTSTFVHASTGRQTIYSIKF